MSATITPARRAAFDVLWRVANEDAFASNLIASSQYDSLSAEDRALMQELVLGVLRWQGHLDALIAQYAQRTLKKLDPEVVIALRMGLYQLRFLTRIPPHAAINESVNLAKARKKQSAAPLVNAVLREATRDEKTDPFAEIKNSAERLSLEISHPLWLIERWISRFGDAEARALALANNTAPRAAFRFNPRVTSEKQTRAWLDEHSIQIRDSELVPNAAVIESGSLAPQSEPVQRGWIYLQDEASQLAAHLIADCGLRIADSNAEEETANSHRFTYNPGHAIRNPQSAIRNPHFLDLCAAPGSKTTLLMGLLPENARVVACDLHHHRLSLMKVLSARLQARNIHFVQLDAAYELPFDTIFDGVLLDAPCSGLGTLQRHPEIKWRMNEAKIKELSELQKRLLANAASVLRPGGLLTYSVCSTEPEEGEEVIAWFRQANSEFRDVTRERLIELKLDPAPLLTSTFGARTFPHRHATEGFFFCTLWKRK